MEAVLRHATTQPHTPIAALPLLGPGGAQELLARFACTELRPEFVTQGSPLPHEMFEAAAVVVPGKACLVYEGQSLTYEEVRGPRFCGCSERSLHTPSAGPAWSGMHALHCYVHFKPTPFGPSGQ